MATKRKSEEPEEGVGIASEMAEPATQDIPPEDDGIDPAASYTVILKVQAPLNGDTLPGGIPIIMLGADLRQVMASAQYWKPVETADG